MRPQFGLKLFVAMMLKEPPQIFAVMTRANEWRALTVADIAIANFRVVSAEEQVVGISATALKYAPVRR